MSRPKTKDELIALASENHQKLMNFIDALPADDQAAEFPPGTMNRSIRDVLTHLHHWHLMLLEWYKVGMTGEKPDMPAKGFTWKTMPELNKRIWEDYQQTDLAEGRQLFEASHEQVRETIQSHTNEELFDKKRYKWTSSTSMGAYFISATSSHYDWALKLIKKAKK